jgi:hypothetical protein
MNAKEQDQSDYQQHHGVSSPSKLPGPHNIE